jgi:2-oxoglutarate ferredoxin oxidoreductase subunit beta
MEIERKIEKVYGFPGLLTDRKGHFCPGCSHGILSKVIAETIAGMGCHERAVGVYGAGCASIMYEYIDIKSVAAPPGSAVGIAAGIKDAMKSALVFAYIGDADMMSDLSVVFGAAMRNDKITVICENNFNMGISGGAMSPTTPLGIATTTSPSGRSAPGQGSPLALSEIIRGAQGVTYCARGSSHSPGAVKKVKAMIKKAFMEQLFGSGMSFVEVAGMCPTNLNLPPVEAAMKIKEILEDLPTGEMK